MSVNYKKHIGLTALGIAVIYQGCSIIRGYLKDLERNRQYNKRRKAREEEEAAEAARRQAQRDEEYEKRKKEREERAKKREEEQKPDGELETLEIKGELHYKNRYGQWCPFKNKTNGDVTITVSKTKKVKGGQNNGLIKNRQVHFRTKKKARVNSSTAS